MFKQAFETIARAQESAHPIVDGDYLGDDGLYRCGVCSKPKQARIPRPAMLYPEGGAMVVPKMFSCAVARSAAEREPLDLQNVFASVVSFGQSSVPQNVSCCEWQPC